VPSYQDRYLASESIFYRLLRDESQLAHRRSESPAQTRTKPRAISATASNQGIILSAGEAEGDASEEHQDWQVEHLLVRLRYRLPGRIRPEPLL